ncbi:hypothetical protein FOA52_010791 [Chlamydomonas sp. UWO 241]|nr:hypothetical protein FOA52_010791 [Chlamydomonas sp. UWO 241]
MPRHQLGAALWLAVLTLLLTLPTGAQARTVTSSCVAGLVRDILIATGDNISADDKYTAVAKVVNAFVSSCTDGFDKSSSGLRPLRILAPLQAENDMERIVADFESRTGYRVITEYVDHLDIIGELQFIEQTSPLAYDGWFVDGASVVDLVTTTTLVAPLNAFITQDSKIQWSDVTEYVREITSTYGGVTIGVPIGGKPVSLMYRRDVFTAADLSTPNTWEDLVYAAQTLNSSDFNADGEADYALCWQLSDCNWDGQIAVSQILASMTQTTGPRTGFLWDPATMELLGGAAVMTRTMELIQELLPYSATSCEILNPHFMSGDCAITIAFESLFKGVSLHTSMQSLIGTAMVPGSTRALNRQTGRLEECTPALCPLAALERTYNGSMVLVNRAPHFGIGSFSGFVNAYQDEGHQQATYSLWSFISEPIYSKELVMTAGVVGPYRKSHLDTSAQSLAAWGAIGYNKRAVTDFLTTIKGSLEHPNFVPDLRMLGGHRYMATLYSALQNATAGMAPAQIAANVAAEHAAILASSGPRDVVQRSLQAGLGIPVASPPPPHPTQQPDTHAGGSDRLAINLGVVIPLAVLLLALVIVVVVMRYRRRSLFDGLLAPSPGEGTTLVVTDIMNSTPLWETLGPDVMECAIATHNTVVRQTLAKWSGYEQATEGDSFLLAFHTPSDALGFALQLQRSLLEAAWEPELLQHPLCAPLAMGPCAALQGAGGGDGRFALLLASRLLTPGDGPFNRPSAIAPGCLFNFASDGSWDNALALFVPPDSQSTLCAAGSAVQSHLMVRTTPDRMPHAVAARSKSATAAAPSLDAASLHGRSRVYASPSAKKAAKMAEPAADTEGMRQLDKARELLQSLHSAASASENAASLDSSVPGGVKVATISMAKFLRLAWTLEGSPADTGVVKSQVTVFKGLRVRIGMHSGVQNSDVERNATSGRVYFGGAPLAIAKAVGDAGAGGMVLMTKQTFERLHPDRALKGVLALAMGQHTTKDDTLGHVCVYQAIERPLVARLAVFQPLRGLSTMETGVMDAPVGTVTIAFANMVGLATLQAWDRDRSEVALDAYAALSKQLLHNAGGYLVDLTSSGLCLAAFHHPVDAVAWGAGLIEVMKHRQWDEELLSHELCEEVRLHEPVCEFTGGSTPLQSRVLFRGPRIKIGIDVGKVQADVASLTGRMTYQGKVMNRAARISSKASSGMQWCSAEVWEQAREQNGVNLLAAGIRGTQIGSFSLKGVIGNVELVERKPGHHHKSTTATTTR